MNISRSRILFEEAQKLIPGGVNSPVRAFKSVGGTPIFMKKGMGSKIYDVNDNEYVDYIGSWGPHLFGHNPDFILNAVKSVMDEGMSFGAPTEIEVKMAKIITELVPSVQMVRMVSSGTEAAMSAVRVARGFTGREKIIKFEGCYHGHADFFLIKAGSGALTLGVPTSPGVTQSNAADTLIAAFNDIESVRKLFSANKGKISAVIIEPVAGNMGVVPAEREFLMELKGLCENENSLLIFDEVMTGFRLSGGGAQELYGVHPDITVFGKVIGGGLPVGAFGGRKEIMEKVSPVGPVYQAGTLSGNPVAMAAGYAALSYIKNNPGLYRNLENNSGILEEGLRENLKLLGKKYVINRVGSMLTLFFTEREVVSFKDAVTSDTVAYGKFFHSMLERGHYLPPAQFEALFVSAAHSLTDIDKTIRSSYEALKLV